jgi:hypothetical protein
VPTGYSLQSDYVMGPFVLFALLGQAPMADEVIANEAYWQMIQHWRQDSLSIFSGVNNEVAVSYRVRFDDMATAKAVAMTMAKMSGSGMAVHRAGTEVEVLAAEDAAVLDGWSTHADACPTAP